MAGEFAALERLRVQADEENKVLRRLLAVRVAGALLYHDDGELQDATAVPHIDFKRESPESIEAKLIERGRRAFAAMPDCSDCKGTGEDGTNDTPCPVCGGTGKAGVKGPHER